MDDLFRITTQFLHVLAGVLWIGGGFYTLFVQLPALLAAPERRAGPSRRNWRHGRSSTSCGWPS